MKRDLQLVRKILFYFEEKNNWAGEVKVEIPNYDDKLVSYHIDIMYEAGLINGEPVLSKEGRIYDVMPFRLTWSGHEFLDNTKGGRWEKILKKVKEKGGDFTFDTIKKLATKYAEEQLFG